MKANLSAIQLTQRDVDLLIWINGFGFVYAKHITAKWNCGIDVVRRRMRKLVAAGYLDFDRLWHNGPGAYRITNKARKLIHDDLPPLKHIDMNTVNHDTKVIALSLILGGQFITERRLRKDKGVAKFGSKRHICDGVLQYNDKSIAIEVELTKKSKRRRDAIIKQYVKQIQFQEVWYFCGDDKIIKALKEYEHKYAFLKLFRLDDVLNNYHHESKHVVTG